MNMVLVLRHVLPRMTESVLPRTEERLWSSKYEGVVQALRDVDVSGMEFRSLVDWFLCLALPEFLPGCRAFYADEGPKLSGLYTREELRRLDRALCRILDDLHVEVSTALVYFSIEAA